MAQLRPRWPVRVIRTADGWFEDELAARGEDGATVLTFEVLSNGYLRGLDAGEPIGIFDAAEIALCDEPYYIDGVWCVPL